MSTPRDPFSIFFDCFFKKPKESLKHPQNRKNGHFTDDITQDVIITLCVFILIFAIIFLFFLYSLIFG